MLEDIKKIDVSPDVQHLHRHVTQSWLYFLGWLRQLEPNESDLLRLKQVLKAELMARKRSHIAQRILSRYNKLQAKKDRRILEEYLYVRNETEA